MSVREVICAICGAINRDVAEPCWRCRESLAPAAASTDGRTQVLEPTA
jgi:hypothetical protein